MFVRRVNGVRDWVSMNGLVVREAGIGLVALVNVERRLPAGIESITPQYLPAADGSEVELDHIPVPPHPST